MINRALSSVRATPQGRSKERHRLIALSAVTSGIAKLLSWHSSYLGAADPPISRTRTLRR